MVQGREALDGATELYFDLESQLGPRFAADAVVGRWVPCIGRFQRRTGGGMRRSRRRRWDTAGSPTSPGSLGATPKPCGTARKTWRSFPWTRPPAASEKKGGRKPSGEAQPGLVQAVENAVADRMSVRPSIRRFVGPAARRKRSPWNWPSKAMASPQFRARSHYL